MGRSYEARAKKAVEEGSWLELAWANVANEKFLDLIYQAATENDAELKLAVRRFSALRAHDPWSWEPFLDTPQSALAPMFVAAMHNPYQQHHLIAVMRYGVDLGGPVVHHLKKSKAKEVIFPILAFSLYEEDRDAAFGLLAETDKPFDLAVALACRNDPRGDALLGKTLEKLTAPGYISDHGDEWDDLVFALRYRTESSYAAEWVASMGKLLHRGIEVFRTLRLFFDAGVDGGIRSGLEQFSASLLDDMPETRIRRVGVQLLLCDHQTPQLDDARWLRAYCHPKEYAWPGVGQLLGVHRLCGELFIRAGNEEEHRWLAGFTRSPHVAVHDLGDRACKKLGITPASRIFVDRITVEQLCEDEDFETLLGLMENDDAIWSSEAHYEAMNQVEHRAEDDEVLMKRLLTWAKSKVEGQHNYPISTSEMAPPDTCYALSFLADLSDEHKEAWLSDSQSPWIRTLCFQEEVKVPEPHPPARPEGIVVTPLSKTQFAKGSQVNAMAVSRSGKMLCIMGKGGRILSLPDGEQLVTFVNCGWAYDCTFTPDDQHVVACFHGGFIAIYDVETGKLVRQLKGHSGVPHGVRCLTFHHNGDVLATADDNGDLFLWDFKTGEVLWKQTVKGSFTDLLFLPDDRLIASYYKESKRGNDKHAILLVETNGETKRSVKTESTVWSMALREDERLAIGCENYLLIGEWKKKRFVELERYDLPKITRLHWHSEQLWACTEEGNIARLVDGDIELIATEQGALYGMTHTEEMVFAGGERGDISIIEGNIPLHTPPSHEDRVVGLVELGDRSLVTLDRSGLLLKWADGNTELLATLGRAGGSLVAFDEESVICATLSGLSRVHTQTGEILDTNGEESGSGIASAFDDQLVYGSKRHLISFLKLPSFDPDLSREVQEFSELKVLANSPDGLSVLAGSESGRIGLWQRGEWLWQRADHGRDGFDPGNPHKSVCSLAFTPDGQRVISGATDKVIRVYQASDGTPLLRFQCWFGLYNRFSIDRTSRWLAVPDDAHLHIIDLQEATHYATLGTEEFGETAILTAHFLKDDSLIVSNAGGNLYRVTLD